MKVLIVCMAETRQFGMVVKGLHGNLDIYMAP